MGKTWVQIQDWALFLLFSLSLLFFLPFPSFLIILQPFLLSCPHFSFLHFYFLLVHWYIVTNYTKKIITKVSPIIGNLLFSITPCLQNNLNFLKINRNAGCTFTYELLLFEWSTRSKNVFWMASIMLYIDIGTGNVGYMLLIYTYKLTHTHYIVNNQV